jgi:MFS family permease
MIRHHGPVSTATRPAVSYRSVLSRPGVLRLVVLATLARTPQAASGVVMTIHVARTLGAGYAVAGAVVAMATIGMTIGGPWRGRVVDRNGLRRALVPSIVASGVAWGVAPFLEPVGLMIAGTLGGVLALPVFTVSRQSLAVLVPPEGRRVAFSIDSIGTELSFMAGPALAVLICTQWSSTAALLLVGVATVLAGVAFFVLNPPTRSPGADDAGRAGLTRRDWFTPSLAVVLGVSAAATVVLAATDVSIVAVLDDAGVLRYAGFVIVVWSLGSILGVAVYGAVHKTVSPLWLLLALALLTVPATFAHSVLTLSIALFVAGALCAPTLAATTEAVSRLVPEAARGEAMGWHGSALTVGTAFGAPLAGVVIESAGPGAGFLAAGLTGAGIAAAGIAVLAARRWRRRSLTRPPVDPILRERGAGGAATGGRRVPAPREEGALRR